MESSTISSGNNENHLVSNNSSMEPSAKKRKLSIGEMSSTNIETKLLQSAILEWKQYAQKLKAEKLQHINQCNSEKILELENTVKNLQSMNAELQENNEHHQSEIQSIINENTAKNKIFEDEKKGFEAKIKELTDEISTMKTIKSEIKDSVESERENVQNETAKLKDENQVLETKAQETESILFNTENKNKEMDKKYGEITAKNQQLEQKCKTFEAMISKNKKEYQTTIDGLRTEIQELKDKNKILENNVREEKEIVSLDEVSSGTNLDLSLLSCKSNIIMNVAKLEGISLEGWKLYSTLNVSEKPRLLTEKDYAYQTIDLLDFIKLVSSKKVQICTICFCTVLKEQNKECEMNELLMHLPNITEFKHHWHSLKENFSTISKNLGKLDKFRNLQKFEISQYFDSLNFEDMDSFIKKNNKDISYVFKFPLVQKSLHSKIKRSQKELLKALPIPYDIKIELQQ